jgi:D-beta-D-heptose 7-phosphate kinase/D-beta-D-heptose 1-phosphate adenosyltransferase
VIACPDFANCTVLVIGDVMLDRYFWGDVERISPESPVPVVRVEKKTLTLGGAGNVAKNLKGLNCKQVLLGVRGDDSNGASLKEILKKEGIRNELIPVKNHPTTTKTRILSQNQQLLRLDEENSKEIPKKILKKLLDSFDKALPEADVVIVSDYGKGVFPFDVVQHIIKRCRSKNVAAFIDPKGFSWERYSGATCVTPNTAELNLIAPFPADDETILENQANKLIEKYDLDYMLVTRGPKGISLFRRGRPARYIATHAREVYDVSGAGDTVIASLAAAFGAGLKMSEAAALANIAGGIVVGKVGTQPILESELKQALWGRTLDGVNKIVSKNQAQDMIAEWRRNDQRIVFTNGCFDILHIGHIKLLHAAADEGDKLIIGLNSDFSVKKLKGDSRPVVPEAERAALLSSIKGVDLVVFFHEETPLKLIRSFKPDIIVKGGDYTPEQVVGHEIVEQDGGKVVIVPLIDGISTTKVIESVKPK